MITKSEPLFLVITYMDSEFFQKISVEHSSALYQNYKILLDF